MLVALE
jgi:hypothetical protein